MCSTFLFSFAFCFLHSWAVQNKIHSSFAAHDKVRVLISCSTAWPSSLVDDDFSFDQFDQSVYFPVQRLFVRNRGSSAAQSAVQSFHTQFPCFRPCAAARQTERGVWMDRMDTLPEFLSRELCHIIRAPAAAALILGIIQKKIFPLRERSQPFLAFAPSAVRLRAFPRRD